MNLNKGCERSKLLKKQPKSLTNILHELDWQEELKNKNNSFKDFKEKKLDYCNNNKSCEIIEKKESHNSSQRLLKSDSDSMDMKINKASICSLSTRDEELLSRKFDCFDLNNKSQYSKKI